MAAHVYPLHSSSLKLQRFALSHTISTFECLPVVSRGPTLPVSTCVMDPYHYQTASSLHHSQQQPLTSISNLANHASHAYNSDSPGPANTLPPLNGHNNSSTYQPAAVYKNGHSGHQTPRVPHTPDTPSSAEQPQPQQHSLPHLAPQQPHMNVAEPHVGAYAPTASYSYQENSPTIYHSPGQQQNGFSMAGMPQYSQGPLPHIGPAVQGTYDRQSEQASYSYGPTSQAENQSRQSDPRPMPVVGSQGRRGILPSISGRAPPVGSAPDGSMRGVTQPTKNSENKYQCQYCTKTYLHLKHLKRHHLRRMYRFPTFSPSIHYLLTLQTLVSGRTNAVCVTRPFAVVTF